MSDTLLQRIKWMAEQNPQTGQVTAYATDILELLEAARNEAGGGRSQWRTECGHLARLTVNGVCTDCRIIRLEAALDSQHAATDILHNSVNSIAQKLNDARQELAGMVDLLRRIEAWLVEHEYDFGMSSGVRKPYDLYLDVCRALKIEPHWERESKT